MRCFILTLSFIFGLYGAPALCEVVLPSARDAWSPPTLSGTTIGVAYLTLTSPQNDALVRVESPVAGKIELHTHQMQGDIVQMRKLNTIPLAAEETVILAPRGLHLMLYQLQRPLKEGDHYPLTLYYASGAKMTITAAVSAEKLREFLK
jgi:copper(I)-binding protein